MKKNTNVIIVAGSIIVLAGLIFLLTRRTGQHGTAPTESPVLTFVETPTATTTPSPSVIPNATATATVKAPVPNYISVKNFAFSPDMLAVKAGTTVTWTNEDAAPHQIASDPYPDRTALPDLFSEPLPKGHSYSYTFTKKGTFGYHCQIHPFMKGQIIVQ